MGEYIYLAGYYLINAYSWLIVGYILMSWFPNARESKVGQLIASIVEPYLSIFRKIIPSFGGIDFSPILAIFVYRFIASFALDGIGFLASLI